MKKVFIASLLFVSALSSFSFNLPNGGSKWWICDNANCCKTKSANDCPWENGCRGKTGSGMHHYVFAGNAGNFNWTCRNCDAEVYLTSGQSPSASKCCETGGTHSWYHR